MTDTPQVTSFGMTLPKSTLQIAIIGKLSSAQPYMSGGLSTHLNTAISQSLHPSKVSRLPLERIYLHIFLCVNVLCAVNQCAAYPYSVLTVVLTKRKKIGLSHRLDCKAIFAAKSSENGIVIAFCMAYTGTL